MTDHPLRVSRLKLRPAPAPAMQGRHSPGEQDVEPYATKYSCSTHQVTYYQPTGTKATCPVCDYELKNERQAEAIVQMKRDIEMLRGQVRRLQPLVDVSSAIRDALEILGPEDLLWLKTQMYQYKIDKSVALKVTHGRPAGSKKKKATNVANGFIAMPRNGEPEGYMCTSLGGLAIAEYFDEALHTMGSAQTMGMLLKAMWKILPGAQQ